MKRSYVIVAIALLMIVGVFSMEPIPQDQAYFDFADKRRLLGIDNFWNVVSNLPFLLVGAAGLLLAGQQTTDNILRFAQPVFFFGILTTAFGSAWFHFAPSNASLVWDRLPMTVGFMALFCLVVGDFASRQTAKRLFVPLLVIGALSVLYWEYTEHLGAGDLRPYAVVQFVPIFVIPLLLIMYPDRNGMRTAYLWMIGTYVLAKLFEFFDAQIYGVGELLSGHSLKHVAAAVGPLIYLLAVRKKARV